MSCRNHRRDYRNRGGVLGASDNNCCRRRNYPGADALEDAYNAGFNDGFCEGYEQGERDGCEDAREDAINCLRRIRCR